MPLLADKHRLSDVAFADIEAASTTRSDALELLTRLVTIARPNQGAATLLVALSHVATRAWLRGALRVRLRAREGGVHLDVVEDLGRGQRVPLFLSDVRVGLPELATALPHLRLHPLRLVRKADDAIVLGVALRGKRASLEPPPPSEPPSAIAPIPAAPRAPKDEEIDESW